LHEEISKLKQQKAELRCKYVELERNMKRKENESFVENSKQAEAVEMEKVKVRVLK
jgi:hypothetical protein